MLPLNTTAILAALVGSLALFGAGAWTGHQVTHNAWKADQAAQETALRERYQEEVTNANARADEAERTVEAIRAGTRVVTRTVDRIVTRDRYRNVCLDSDGLRAVDAALGRAPADAAEPATALPGSPAPGGRDGSLDPAHAH